MRGGAHVDAPTVVEPAQLLQFFTQFQRRGAQLDQGFQRRPCEPIQADVLHPRPVAVGDGASAEHLGAPGQIPHHLDAVGRVDFRVSWHGLGQGHHRRVRLSKHLGELGDLVRMDKRLVALHVEDPVELFSLPFQRHDSFMTADRAVGAICRSHDCLPAKAVHHVGDAGVVRGDHHLGAGFRARACHAFVDALDHGNAGDHGQGFAWEAGRPVPGRNHNEHFHRVSESRRCTPRSPAAAPRPPGVGCCIPRWSGC